MVRFSMEEVGLGCAQLAIKSVRPKFRKLLYLKIAGGCNLSKKSRSWLQDGSIVEPE